MGLSVAIVCRNNSATIGRTLDSVRGLATEIVAVDSGSTDGTLDLLAAAGARVIQTEWKGHVATKQIALDACRESWTLALDSDESLEPDLARSVRETLEHDAAGAIGDVDACRVNRVVWYRDRPLRHAWQPEWRVRMARRGRARWAGLDPHDCLEPIGEGRVRDLAGTLRHDSIATFAAFLAKQAGHAESMARSLHRAGRRGSVTRLVTSPVGAFLKQIVLKSAWRDGWPGWLAASSTAAATLMKHAALIELDRAGRGEGADRGGGSTPRA